MMTLRSPLTKAFIVIGVLTPLVVSALSIAPPVPFKDVSADAWYATYVNQASSMGIVSGYTDAQGRLTGYFGPGNNVTMAEALKIAIEAAGYDTSRYPIAIPLCYPTSACTHWSYMYTGVASYENFAVMRNFSADRAATRAEVAQIFADAFRVQLSNGGAPSFTDVTADASYAPSVEALARDNIVSGDTDASGQAMGTFRPLSRINRAETAKIGVNARLKYGTPGEGRGPGTGGTTSSSGTCSVYDCGPQPGMPLWQCPDGSIGGPICERQTSGQCGYTIRQCPATSSSSSSKSSSSSSSQTVSATIDYGPYGFSPSTVTIQHGQTVRFRNVGAGDVVVASNPHPTHTDYPGFYSPYAMGVGQEWTFTFTKKGTWGYHNHLFPAHTAQIVVE